MTDHRFPGARRGRETARALCALPLFALSAGRGPLSAETTSAKPRSSPALPRYVLDVPASDAVWRVMPILPGCVGETYVGVVRSHPERLSVVVLDSILPSGAAERLASEFLRSWIPAIENTSGSRVVASASLAVPVPVPGSLRLAATLSDGRRQMYWNAFLCPGDGVLLLQSFSSSPAESPEFSRFVGGLRRVAPTPVESPFPSAALIPPASVTRATIAPAGVTTAQIPTGSNSFASVFAAQVPQPYDPATTVRVAIAPLSTSGRAASPTDPSAMAWSVAKLTETGTAGLDRPVIELRAGIEAGRSLGATRPTCDPKETLDWLTSSGPRPKPQDSAAALRYSGCVATTVGFALAQPRQLDSGDWLLDLSVSAFRIEAFAWSSSVQLQIRAVHYSGAAALLDCHSIARGTRIIARGIPTLRANGKTLETELEADLVWISLSGTDAEILNPSPLSAVP